MYEVFFIKYLGEYRLHTKFVYAGDLPTIYCFGQKQLTLYFPQSLLHI